MTVAAWPETLPVAQVRIVRPTDKLREVVTFYRDLLGLEELFRFEEIWAAAGHPHSVFKLRPQDLERLTGAPVADVVQSVEAA